MSEIFLFISEEDYCISRDTGVYPAEAWVEFKQLAISSHEYVCCASEYEIVVCIEFLYFSLPFHVYLLVSIQRHALHAICVSYGSADDLANLKSMLSLCSVLKKVYLLREECLHDRRRHARHDDS